MQKSKRKSTEFGVTIAIFFLMRNMEQLIKQRSCEKQKYYEREE